MGHLLASQFYYMPSIPLLAISSAIDEPLDRYFGAKSASAPPAACPLTFPLGASSSCPNWRYITQTCMRPCGRRAGVAKTVLMRLMVGMGSCAIVGFVFPFEPNSLTCGRLPTPSPPPPPLPRPAPSTPPHHQVASAAPYNRFVQFLVEFMARLTSLGALDCGESCEQWFRGMWDGNMVAASRGATKTRRRGGNG